MSYLPEILPGLQIPEGELYTPYYDAARRNELVVQQCRACGGYQWAPEYLCHHCFSFDVAFTSVEPNGEIYSWERIWHPASAALTTAVPYLVVLVALPRAGGVRMVGNLLGDPRQTVTIGAAVNAVFEHHETFSLVQWQAATTAP